jgi:hypothetical protein
MPPALAACVTTSINQDCRSVNRPRNGFYPLSIPRTVSYEGPQAASGSRLQGLYEGGSRIATFFTVIPKYRRVSLAIQHS